VEGAGEDAVWTVRFDWPKLAKNETPTDETRPWFVIQNKTGLMVKRRDLTELEIAATFSASLQDAEDRKFDEISRNLKAIDPGNTDSALVWDGDKKERVKVLVWTGDYWNEEKAYPGAHIEPSPADDTKLGYFMYVILYEEAVEFMKNEKFALNTEMNNRMRLAQKLGLQAADGNSDRKKRFLVLWASPEALFRPAPDPEVNDGEAVLAMRYGQVEVANDWTTKHYDWKRANSYDEHEASWNAYPFSGFGYTYDWADVDSGRLEEKIGFSEFVVLPENSVEVIANVPTADFFDSIPLR
jgi:hypothetical protein